MMIFVIFFVKRKRENNSDDGTMQIDAYISEKRKKN